jgi:1,2-dihydroxy-3-keto-5-methylthiopentene dioxygenase
MSRIRLFNDTDPSTVLLETREHAAIAAELAKIGVRF